MPTQPRPLYSEQGSSPDGGNRTPDLFTTTESWAGVPPWYAHKLYQQAQESHRINKIPYVAPPQSVEESIAGLGPLFDQAKNWVNSPFSRTAWSQDYNKAREATDMAEGRDILRNAAPYLEDATNPGNQYIQNYLRSFEQNVANPMIARAQRDWVADILPKIDRGYIQGGAFHGGMRQAARLKSLEKQRESTLESIGLAQQKALNEAYQHDNAMRNLNLHSAEVAGNLTGKNREADLALAATRSGLAGKEQQLHAAQAEALKTLGAQEVSRNQQVLDEEMRRHYEQLNHPFERLQRDQSILRGMHIPTSVSTSARPSTAPVQANPYVQASNLFSQMSGMSQMKKGGRVRQKFADGGQVPQQQAYPQYQDSQLPAFNTPEMAQVRNIAGELQQNPNPMGMALMRMGTMDPYGNPLRELNKAVNRGMDQYERSHDTKQFHKTQAANLMDKINQSRLAQHKILTEYAQDQRDFAQKQRVDASLIDMHNASAANSRSSARLHEAQMLNRGKGEPEPIYLGDKVINPKRKIGLTPQDRTLINKLVEEVSEGEKVKSPYSSLKDFYETNPDIPTGNWAKIKPDWMKSAKEAERSRLINKVVTSELPAGTMTKDKREFTESGKPTERDPAPKVVEFSKKGADLIDKINRPKQLAIEYSAYDIPPRITIAAYEQWEKEGSKGNFEDYLAAMLEGKVKPSSGQETKSSQQSTQNYSLDSINEELRRRGEIE